MYYSFWRPSYSEELYHFGVKGMRWGVIKKHRIKERLENYLKRVEATGNLIPSYAEKRGAEYIKQAKARQMDLHLQQQQTLMFQQAGQQAVQTHQEFLNTTLRVNQMNVMNSMHIMQTMQL